jgi:hypothetical protein
LLKSFQHAIQQELFGSAGYQPRAKLREHAEVKPRIRQFQSERLLPVNAGAHRLGSLTITPVLEKLQYGHQDQSPGC